MRKIFFLLLIGMLTSILANQKLCAAELNQKITPFTIFDFQQDHSYSSSDFVNHKNNILIFWDTHCQKCLNALKSIWEKKMVLKEMEVNVITINTNHPDNMYEAIDFSRDSPYPVYYDMDKIVMESFGATYNEFFAFIIDQDFNIKSIVDESLPNAGDIIVRKIQTLEENWTTSDESPSIQATADPIFEITKPQKVFISGEGKTRFLDVNLDDPRARGPYGEELVAGSTLKYYLVPRIHVLLTDKLHLGSYIRVTNIADEYLFGAPDYYSNTIFSPYIFYRFNKNFSSTIGFYRLSISPLTIMRWDEKDNPPGAGGAEGACGACGGIVGGISAENLEKLGPDIGFEGAHFKVNFDPSLQGQFFYARPLIANEDFSRYHQHLLGGQISRHFSTANLIRLNYVGTFEQAPKNVEEETGFARLPLKTDHLLSGIFSFNQFKTLRLTGEAAYFNRSYSALDTFQVFSLENTAGIAYLLESELIFTLINNYQFKIAGAYISIDKDFEPSYKAISYISNRRGFRLRGEISSDKIGVILFVKSLKDIKDTSQKINTMGFGTNGEMRLKRISFKSYLYYSLENIKDPGLNSEGNKRHILSLGISVEPNPQFSFLLAIQNVKEKTIFRADNSRLISVYNFLKF